MALQQIITELIADSAVHNIKIADDAITTAKIANDAITTDKLANAINSEIAANTAKVTNATHTGDVIGATVLTIADAAITQAKLGTEFTEVITYDQGTGFPSVLDFSAADQWIMNDMANYLTLNITNAQPGMVKLLSIYPMQGVLTWDSAITVKVLNGTFDDLFNWNYIQILCQAANTFLITISQEQV